MPLHKHHFSSLRRKDTGFTLILALFLLSILASLGVAFGLLVVLESKASLHKRHVIRARENARTAMNQALQTIQEPLVLISELLLEPSYTDVAQVIQTPCQPPTHI